MMEILVVLLIMGILVTMAFTAGRILRGGVDDLTARETLKAVEAGLVSGLNREGTRDITSLGISPATQSNALAAMLEERVGGTSVTALTASDVVGGGGVGVWAGEDSEAGRVFLVVAGNETCYVAKHNPRLDGEDSGTQYATVAVDDCGRTTAVTNLTPEGSWKSALEAPDSE